MSTIVRDLKQTFCIDNAIIKYIEMNPNGQNIDEECFQYLSEITFIFPSKKEYFDKFMGFLKEKDFEIKIFFKENDINE